MEFNNLDEIKQQIMISMLPSIQMMQQQVYQVIDRFVKQYYADYSPVLYFRTHQLYRSLVKSEITKTENGYFCEVYFDLDRLDYYMKRIDGEWVRNKGWSEQKTLDNAAKGIHGNHIFQHKGESIWDDPIKILNRNANATFKRMLKANGIPLK